MKKLLLVVLLLIGLQTQAQHTVPYFCCDSITYWTDQSQGFNVGLDTSNIVHNPDSIEVWWGACTNGLCYAGQGMYYYFPQITTTDTVKLTYDVYIYENGMLEICSIEDWLVFNGTNWVLYNMNTVGTNELQITWENDGYEQIPIVYDIMGRKLLQVNIGQVYIRNNKKYMIIK